MQKQNQSEREQRPSRRDFIKTSAILGGAALAGPLSITRGAHAAGSDVIKVGLIGCGGRGSGAAANAMNAGKDVRLVAMADVFADRLASSREQLKKMYPEQMVVDDQHCFVGFDAYQQVIQSGVDVVVIACTSHFHAVALKAAVDAGKHVFVEKPVALDVPGVKLAMAASEAATKKNLSLVNGLCWRYDLGVRECVKRILDGQIGEIIAIQEHYLRGPYGLRERKPEWNEMQYQLQNWYHFNWLSGDDFAQSLIHNISVTSWVVGDVAPLQAWGMGGRQICTEPKYGDAFDSQAVVYEYANGIRIFGYCRDIPAATTIPATSSSAPRAARSCPAGPRSRAKKPWHYHSATPPPSMYDVEHKELFESIRAGKPLTTASTCAFAPYWESWPNWPPIPASRSPGIS